MLEKKLNLFVSAVIGLSALTSALLSQSESEGFSYAQILGPLSNPSLLFIFSITLGLSSVGVLWLVWSELTSYRFIWLIGTLLVLSIALKFFLPVFEASYFQALFADGVSKVNELQWVVFTHHTTGGFVETLNWHAGSWSFWGIFTIVIFGQPSTPLDGIFVAIVKWSPVLFSVLYLPVVYFLMRSYGLRNRFSLVGIFAFYGLSIWPFWFASQMLGNVLYWLFLAMLPRAIKGGWPNLIAILLVLTSIVTVHQGVATFTLASLISIPLAAVFFGLERKTISRSARILLFFIAIWSAEIVFSIPSFAYSLEAGLQSLYSDIFHGASSISYYSYRGYLPYENLVHFIEAYYLAVVIIPSLILAYYSFRYRGIQTSISTGVLVITTLVVGLATIGPAGGGAGGINRIPAMLVPLSAFGLAYQAGRFKGVRTLRPGTPKSSKLPKYVYCLIIAGLAVSGTIVYFSGSNINWVPYSQLLGENGNVGPFFYCHAQVASPCTVYAIGDLTQMSPPYSKALASAAYPFNRTSSAGFYTFYQTGLNSYLDLYGGNATSVNSQIQAVFSRSDILYETPTTVFLYILN